jgi:deoxyadenosine/deoxycytidine kinase
LQNVYLKQSKDLQGRVDFFLKRRDWYDAKGIPHTLGIVMYGTPGCGKTSTIKAIANTTKRHIFNLLLSEIKTKDALKDLFYSDEVNVTLDGKLQVLNIPLKQRLYVIEDIDAMNSVVLKRSAEQLQQEQDYKLKLEAELVLLKQTQGDMMARNMIQGKDESSQDKLDLATLLNVLDGVRETPGRIIVLSTNYPERLDEALLRPGRFDMMLEFEKHSCLVLQQHLEAHYDVVLKKEQVALVRTPSLEKKWTPAEVSQILFRRIGDLDGALQDLLEEDPAKLFRFSQQQPQLQTEVLQQQPEVFVKQEQEQEEMIQSTDLETLLKEEEAQEHQPQERYLKTSEKPDPAQVFKDCIFSTDSILFGTHADMGLLSANDTGLPVLKQAPEAPSLELPSHSDILTGQQSGQQTIPPEQFGSLPAEYFGFAAANEDAEPSLDDYFPSID